jgi:hypothetical protein
MIRANMALAAALLALVSASFVPATPRTGHAACSMVMWVNGLPNAADCAIGTGADGRATR